MINVCATAVSFAIPTLRTRTFELHPVQVLHFSFVLAGTFAIPTIRTRTFDPASFRLAYKLLFVPFHFLLKEEIFI